MPSNSLSNRSSDLETRCLSANRKSRPIPLVKAKARRFSRGHSSVRIDCLWSSRSGPGGATYAVDTSNDLAFTCSVTDHRELLLPRRRILGKRTHLSFEIAAQ